MNFAIVWSGMWHQFSIVHDQLGKKLVCHTAIPPFTSLITMTMKYTQMLPYHPFPVHTNSPLILLPVRGKQFDSAIPTAHPLFKFHSLFSSIICFYGGFITWTRPLHIHEKPKIMLMTINQEPNLGLTLSC